jgi:flagellar hook-basal body complex protein FliE
MADLNLMNLNPDFMKSIDDPGMGALSPGVGQPGDRRVLDEMQRQGMKSPVDSAGTTSAGTSTFAQMLDRSVQGVNELQVQADTAVKNLVAGRTKNVHETMLTLERADTSLKLMMQVRNKVLDAYREIMRMQV